MDEDDEIPTLPADTLALLQQFNSEKDARAKEFEDLKSSSEAQFSSKQKLSMDLFTEDWNASQFWYSDATATTLAEELLHGADEKASIAVVSAPSVYIALHNILLDRPDSAKPMVRLLEYDDRFAVLGAAFIKYDYTQSLRLPSELKGGFDRIICDPPFLSEDCQTKTALTVRWLARSWTQEGLRLLSCTGERMERTMRKLYGKVGLRTTDLEIVHRKGLSNEFRCYANFGSGRWDWR